MTPDALRAIMRRRMDGDWQYLATAAGEPGLVDFTIRALSSSELDRGHDAIDPFLSHVPERVEALAAFDINRLVSLARTWRLPEEVSGLPWWDRAWIAALRHVAPSGVITPSQARFGNLEWFASMIWDPPEVDEVSWHELKQSSTRTYQIGLPRLARAKLREQRITASDLLDADPWLLRLLRGRTDRLEADARALLDELTVAALQKGEDASILLETACAVSDSAARARYSDMVAATLATLSTPEPLTCCCYILLGNGWQLP
ncbi:MAG: hypothetical protein IT370_13005 [Deltaproteobacteria bacterium]|nr:hypothetical protein [Deltaproteobacteria bacterium]